MEFRGARRTVTRCAALAWIALPSGLAAAQDCAPPGTAPFVPGWQPIETAPKDMEILLGAFFDGRFAKGVGRWDVRDELGGGLWTVEDWWGESPTYWAAIPPAPCR